MKTALTALLVSVLVGCVTVPESGRRTFILTSEAQENALGEQAFRETLAKSRLSTNRRWLTILQRVAGRVATAADRPDFKWEVQLIESREANAFCLPGGKIAFYTGIFPKAVNEAGLAAIMGHEVAHATARHAGERLTIAFGTQVAFEGLNAILGGGNTTRRQLLFAALGVGAQVGVVLPFSRANETEADSMGLVYMARAGYDPAEAPRFWQRFADGKSSPLKFLSTHPPSEERMQKLTDELPKAQSTYWRSPKYGTGEVL